MSAKIEEIIKNQYKPQKPKKNNKQRKTNKGKRLRNGKYVFYTPYHERLEKDSLKIKIKGKSFLKSLKSKIKLTKGKVWKSEITGRTYSSEKRMRAAEKASERMKGKWERKRIEQIEEKYLPLSWYSLPSSIRDNPDEWVHGDSAGDSILAYIFSKTQGAFWRYINEGTLLQVYDEIGLDTHLSDDSKSLRDFLQEVIGIDWENIDWKDLPELENNEEG